MGSYLIGAVILIFIYNFAPAISSAGQCYSCASKSCGDPFNRTVATIENCSVIGIKDIKYSCIKVYLSGKDKTYGNTTVRGCVPTDYQNKKPCDWPSEMSPGLEVKDCYTCDNDLCNSATRWSSSAVLTSVFFATFAYLLLRST